ncbi:MAG: carboxypeptidase regulatory-like domain-containing protein [Candidatus Acidiferrum sp.]
MKGMRRLLTVLLATVFFAVGSSATTCVEVPVPKKPVSHICGRLLDGVGGPIAQAKVRIWKEDVLVAEVQTDDNGKFSFDTLKDGNYDIGFLAEPFHRFSFPITIRKSRQKCNRSLEVVLAIGTSCGCSAALKRL